MAKFRHPSQVGYQRLSDRLRRWVDDIQQAADLLPPEEDFLMPLMRNQDFVGREDILRDILQSVYHRLYMPTNSRRVALSGLGGTDYLQIGRLLTTWLHKENIVSFLEGISQHLSGSTDRKWVLLLDDVYDSSMFFGDVKHSVSKDTDNIGNLNGLIKYLPQSEHGSILMTCRDKDLAVRLTESEEQVLRINVMAEEDAEKKTVQGMPKDTADMVARNDLMHELDFMPPALGQASRYISMHSPHMTIARYLELVRQKSKDEASWLVDRIIDLHLNFRTPQSIIKTLAVLLVQIYTRDPAAAYFFSCMSMLDGQGIPRSFSMMVRNRLCDSKKPLEPQSTPSTHSLTRKMSMSVRLPQNIVTVYIIAAER
ncbi:MAG: hypothetical protein Q9201_004074 [Fulgogasparrea decipioides]